MTAGAISFFNVDFFLQEWQSTKEQNQKHFFIPAFSFETESIN